MASTTAHAEPNPAIIWDTVQAYQRTAALKGAVELELFTAVGEGAQTVPAIAARCKASERGIRILCDFLTVHGLLTKADGLYGLTSDSATFLDKRSPAYLGGVVGFINSPRILSAFDNVAELVRRGTTLLDGKGTVDTDDPVWLDFARCMPAMVMPAAQFLAEVAATDGPQKVLDIAAGHGMFGISLARRNPQAQIVPVDWAGVLEIAKGNAANAGVAGRYRPLAGDAFQVDFGTGYDTVFVTNFLHHFDPPTNETLLRKIRAALNPGGKVYTLEFVPNDDRVSPPPAATFSLQMLGGTPAGDAYTFGELVRMFAHAGFGHTERMDVPRSPETLLVAS
jgi:SAM-dependent methyltransferase